MIDVKRALLLLPFYIAGMLAIDALFNSGGSSANATIPPWMAIGFIASAVAVVAIAIWYVAQRSGSKFPQNRNHAYIGILVGVFVSGFVGDAVSGLTALLAGGGSFWVALPGYAASYAAFLVVFTSAAKALDRRAAKRGAHRSSPR